MFSNIVLATDGSDHANHALDVAIDMAKKYQANLTMVHVLTHDHPSTEVERMIEVEHLDDSYNRITQNTEINILSSTLSNIGMMRSGDRESRVILVIGEQILNAANRKAQAEGLENVSMEIRSGDYANSILEVADENKADIIIMGSRGLSTIKGFMTGSVSHKVSQRAQCSVLTIK